jgi:hypothetical protein
MRAVAAGLLALTIAGCGLRIADSIADSDRVLIDQFFAASRLRDLTAVRKFSTVVFEPASDGIVTGYEITSIADRGATKEVLLTAPVKMFDGRVVTKHLAITIEHGLVTAISEPTALSAGEGPVKSPAAAAAVPSTPRR